MKFVEVTRYYATQSAKVSNGMKNAHDIILFIQRGHGDFHTAHKLERHSLLSGGPGEVGSGFGPKCGSANEREEPLWAHVRPGPQDIKFRRPEAEAVPQIASDGGLTVLHARRDLREQDIVFAKARVATPHVTVRTRFRRDDRAFCLVNRRHRNETHFCFRSWFRIERQLCVDLADLAERRDPPTLNVHFPSSTIASKSTRRLWILSSKP